jgi:sugar/nucleoside kinase (ribokinase family)
VSDGVARTDPGERVLVAAGRLMVDVWTRLAADRFGRGDWVGEINEIRVDVGGPAHVCDGFLRSPADQAILVSAIGASRTDNGRLIPDELGSLALKRLEAKGITTSCMLVEHKQTGRVMLLYHPGGGRLMVSDIVTAPRVTGEYIDGVIGKVLTQHDQCLVYADGYLYLDRSCGDVPAALIRRQRERVRLWVDVLPHTLYKRMSLREFLNRTRALDLITIERATLDGFAAAGSVTADVVAATLLRQGTTLVIVDDNQVNITGRDFCQALDWPSASQLEADQTPGWRDRIVSEFIADHIWT